MFNFFLLAIIIIVGFIMCEDFNGKTDTVELIRSKGYPCEEHNVVTNDGYILTLHRIPFGLNQNSSSTWVINLRNQSLGFILADIGFDVWLGNARGNRYSSKHTNLSTNSEEFWNFSWDEMAKYDLPSMIYYVLKLTGRMQLYYIGYSQGSLMGFSAFSENSNLASKIKLFIALAPVATVNHLKTPMRYLAGPSPFNDMMWNLMFGKLSFLPSNSELRSLSGSSCSSTKELSMLCTNTLLFLCGPSKFLNESRLSVYLHHAPSGTSVRNMVHYSQMHYNKKFQKFDYGISKNLQLYKQTTPPVYNVTSIKIKIALFWSENDWLSTAEDVKYLTDNLQTIVHKSYIKDYHHLDFVWAVNATQVIYKKLISLLTIY